MHPQLRRYLKNLGWLLIPVFVWNLLLISHLPAAFSAKVFWFNIPSIVTTTENTVRFIIFALPFFAPFELMTKSQKVGFAIYGFGMLAYFLSWLALILAPDSYWSASAVGFLAPAYTPSIWLLGLALMMQRLFWRLPYRWWYYLILSIGFLAAHIAHTTIVFLRLSQHSVG